MICSWGQAGQTTNGHFIIHMLCVPTRPGAAIVDRL